MKTRRTMLAMTMAALSLAWAGCDSGGSSSGGSSRIDGTDWRVIGWSASSVNPSDFVITASFSGSTIAGRAPVNTYGGTFSSDAGGAFAVSSVQSTMMAGAEPAMRAEQIYFELLNQARQFKVDGDTLTLSNGSGAQVLIFSRGG